VGEGPYEYFPRNVIEVNIMAKGQGHQKVKVIGAYERFWCCVRILQIWLKYLIRCPSYGPLIFTFVKYYTSKNKSVWPWKVTERKTIGMRIITMDRSTYGKNFISVNNMYTMQLRSENWLLKKTFFVCKNWL